MFHTFKKYDLKAFLMPLVYFWILNFIQTTLLHRIQDALFQERNIVP